MLNEKDEHPSFVRRILANFEEFGNQTYCNVVESGGYSHITWNSLKSDCQAVMASLVGIKPGVVLIFLRHGRWLHGSFFGTMLSGKIPSFMPCSSVKQDSEIYWSSHQELIEHISPVAIITSSDVLKEMEDSNLVINDVPILVVESLNNPATEIPVCEMKDSGVALLQHSSGTTGLKKGVALSFEAIEKHALSYSSSIGLSDSDSIVSWLPLYHDMGLMACMIVPAYFAIPVSHLDPFDWVVNPESLFEVIEQNNGTLSWMPNFAFEHLSLAKDRMDREYDLSSMRAFISCSEVCKPESFDNFLSSFSSFGVSANMLQTCYAMAETVFAVSQSSLQDVPNRVSVEANSLNRGDKVVISSSNAPNVPVRCLLSTGSSIDGIGINIVDEERSILPEKMIGEVAISGDFLFDGYFGLPEKTAEFLSGGFYFSRDLGFIESGDLYVLGRIDDLIIVQGRNIYAHQIEGLVSQIEEVKSGRVCAFGRFDVGVGSEALIVVCEMAEEMPIESQRQLKSEISRAIVSSIDVVPKQIHLVENGWLVKTTSGKVDRKKNQARFGMGA